MEVDSKVETAMKMHLQLKKKETLSWTTRTLISRLVHQLQSNPPLPVLVVYPQAVWN